MNAVRSSIRSSTSPAPAASGGTYPMTCRLASPCTRGSTGGGPTAPGTRSSTPCEPRSATATVAPMRPARASWTTKAWPTPVPPTRSATTPQRYPGRKRHVLVDCLGLLIAVAVTSAYVSDVAGGHQRLRRAQLTNGLLGLVWCDSEYQGLSGHRHRALPPDPVARPYRVHVVPGGAVVGTERPSHNVQASRQLGMSLINSGSRTRSSGSERGVLPIASATDRRIGSPTDRPAGACQPDPNEASLLSRGFADSFGGSRRRHGSRRGDGVS
jgi:hypothetical protein